ncbi:hypothetical protein JL720_88 [Aureococcus anophagefferens]|nr:hypothetical protein JL720_88 [Aureococcus anophagefferens]
MARVRAAALGAALLEAALGQCPTFGRRNYYAEHCEIITYDAASGFAYAWLNAGPCVAGFAAATDADVVAVWPEGADPPYKRNGPRRFMTTCVGFDDAAAVAARAAEPFRLANPPRALGGVEYAVQARLPFESAAAFEGWGDGGLAYEGVLVNRSAVMVWEAGSTVFELVDAAGKRYVMQSLSQIVVENLAPSDLEALPRDLPEGWSFRSRTASRGRDDFRELLLIGNLETPLSPQKEKESVRWVEVQDCRSRGGRRRRDGLRGDEPPVAIRVRPLKESEGACAWRLEEDGSVFLADTGGEAPVPGRTAFRYDAVYGEHVDTRTVYEGACRDLVDGALHGVNGTIFAYGQTSSGKTYTMQGGDKYGASAPGVMHLAAEQIFANIEERSDTDFLLRCSYLEVYNEQLRDLLAADGTGDVRIREDPRTGVYIEGAQEEVVVDASSIAEALVRGERARAVGATAMNERSSRSHTVFRIVVESKVRDDEASGVLVGALSLVDLAGSESVRLTGASGLRAKEGGKINTSLLTPRPTLGGSARLAMVCCVAPAEGYVEETRSTLQFGDRASQVKLAPVVHEILDDASQLRRLGAAVEAKEADLAAQVESVERLKKMIVLGGSRPPRRRRSAAGQRRKRETWAPGARFDDDDDDDGGGAGGGLRAIGEDDGDCAAPPPPGDPRRDRCVAAADAVAGELKAAQRDAFVLKQEVVELRELRASDDAAAARGALADAEAAGAAAVEAAEGRARAEAAPRRAATPTPPLAPAPRTPRTSSASSPTSRRAPAPPTRAPRPSGAIAGLGARRDAEAATPRRADAEGALAAAATSADARAADDAAALAELARAAAAEAGAAAASDARRHERRAAAETPPPPATATPGRPSRACGRGGAGRGGPRGGARAALGAARRPRAAAAEAAAAGGAAAADEAAALAAARDAAEAARLGRGGPRARASSLAATRIERLEQVKMTTEIFKKIQAMQVDKARAEGEVAELGRSSVPRGPARGPPAPAGASPLRDAADALARGGGAGVRRREAPARRARGAERGARERVGRRDAARRKRGAAAALAPLAGLDASSADVGAAAARVAELAEASR